MPGLKIVLDTDAAERGARQLKKDLKSLGSGAAENEKEFAKLEARMKNGLQSDKAKNAIDSLEKSIKLTRLETVKFKASIGDYTGAMKAFISGNEESIKSVTNLGKTVVGLATAFAGYKLSGFVKDVAMAAARYETLGVVMENVGGIAGYSAKQMQDYAKQVEMSGIQMDTSRETVVKLVQAHIDLENAQKLSKIAQDAAVIGNVNSSHALERMVYGIQTAQIEVLKTIGLNVNFENSYKQIALQLGKTQSTLTEAEKTQARLNIVLERGADIAGTYEKAMETAGKQITSFPRYLNDFKIHMGQAFNTATTDTVKALTDVMKSLNEEIVKRNLAGICELGCDKLRIHSSRFAWYY